MDVSPDRAPTPGCPDEGTLAEFVAGTASAADRDLIERHIDACERCGATLRDYAQAFTSLHERDPDDGPPPITGQRFAGRYRIESCVGFGAGGTVYRAHDPELDRTVALKVLRSGPGGSTQPDSRWTREAKVMAKVVHPNVVTVHDVGLADDHLFIAAEFVEGGTLDEWRKEAPRSWQEVLALFVEAGRGLAAIHDCGLVHRDFKPHNVMVGRDGRVRVTDFGLARLLPELDDDDVALTHDSPHASSVFAETLVSRTRPGTLVGTPSYMAPEQLRGELADARSDQFAFCVSFYEALWDRRPFEGKTLVELAERVCNEAPTVPPPRPHVPRWVTAVVLRGLSRRPSDRFEDMHALLHALTEAPRRRRLRMISAAVVTGFAVVAVGGYAAAGLAHDPCEVDEHGARSVLDASRVSITAGLVRAPEIGSAVLRDLDAWAEAWRDTSRQVCEATDAESSSSHQLGLQRACLDRRLSELRAVTEILASSQDGDVERALDILGILARPERCSDAETLAAVEPAWSTPAARMLAREIAGDIDRADALRAAGRLTDARELAETVLTRVPDDDELLAVRAEALVTLGQVQSAVKDADAAEKALFAGIWAAEASGHVEMAARGWIELVNVLGNQREDHAGAERAAERAAAAVHRLRDPGSAIDLAANRAVSASMQGKYEDALEQQRQVLERARAVFPDGHPNIARIHFNVAAVLTNLGRPDEALEHAREGLALFEASFSGRHPVLVEMLNTLGAIQLHRGDKDAGRAYLDRGLALARELLPEGHLNTASIVSNLAQIDVWDGRHAEAADGYRQALAIYRAAYGSEHPDVALSLHNLAAAIEGTGDRQQALALYREALEIRLKASGPDHPGTANTHHNLGLVLVKEERLDEGIEHLERALEVRERAKVDPYRRATTNFMLARAYHKRGETQRALSHAHRSREYLLEIAPRHPDVLEAVENWLTEQGEALARR